MPTMTVEPHPNLITPASFIASCERKYGVGRYDYSLTKYTGAKDQVRIICPKRGHGEFKKRATNFLHQDQGCWKCFLEEREKAKGIVKPAPPPEIAPSVPEHVRNSLQVTLVLSQLGVSAKDIAGFLLAKIPEAHIMETAALWQAVAIALVRHQAGPPKKVAVQLQEDDSRLSWTTKSYVERCRELHSASQFDFSETVYRGMFKPVTLTCTKPGHGTFTKGQARYLLLYKNVCPDCQAASLNLQRRKP